MVTRYVIAALVAVVGTGTLVGLLLGPRSEAGDIKKADEVYLLPDGFTGPVRVIYGVKVGQPPVSRGSSQIYEIPESGMLLTQHSAPTEPAREAFFYVKSDGERQRITNHTNRIDPEGIQDRDEKLYVYHGGVGRSSWPVKLDCFVTVTQHSIGTRRQIWDAESDIDILSYLTERGVECSDIESRE